MSEKMDNAIISSERSDFWEDFDVSESSLEEITEYILGKATFDRNISEKTRFDENYDLKRHFMIYIIINNINGKLYVGQHSTKNIDDQYMGSGHIIDRAYKKYGKENFSRIWLFDFNSFDEMDKMERDIVTYEFKSRKDVYNSVIGGYDSYSAILENKQKREELGIKNSNCGHYVSPDEAAKNAEFQRKMYSTGKWVQKNMGKSPYHNPENTKTRFFTKDEAPNGWIQGPIQTDEDVERHKKIGELVNELHTLGSKYTWKQGDTIEFVSRLVKQFIKSKVREENDAKLWREIFEYYKIHGSTDTMRKYTLNAGMYRKFDKYFHEEYSEFKSSNISKCKNNKDEIERLKREMIEFGLKRNWDCYSSVSVRKIYDNFIKRKIEIDRKVEEWNRKFDEFLKYGHKYIEEKYNEFNIRQKFVRYVPNRYKKYMLETYGKNIDVEENVYKSIIGGYTVGRKKRTPSQAELSRRNEHAEDKHSVIDELIKLGSNVTHESNDALTTLKMRLKSLKKRIEIKRDNIETYTRMYEEWVKNGFKTMCERFDYTGTKGNLKKRFSQYVDNYDKSLIEGRW